MVRRVRTAVEIACCSGCVRALPARACDLRKRAASAASTRWRNVFGSPSIRAASTSRCQEYVVLGDRGVSCAVIVLPESLHQSHGYSACRKGCRVPAEQRGGRLKL